MKEFVVIGISYKKANEKIRGKFSLSIEQQNVLLSNAKKDNSCGFIISTCNRTEIYALASDVEDIYTKWSDVTDTDLEELKSYLYVLQGNDAKNHLFNVGCGLESQILGDFEITSQIKKAFVFAKQIGTTNGYLERIVNTVLQASKEVRSQTKISNGTTSVSYVTVDYIKNYITDYTDKKILLYGLGEIGKLTIENLCKHLPISNLAVINRSESKSKRVAEKYIIKEYEHYNLNDAIDESDILIVATNSDEPTITKLNISPNKTLTIFDLSIPKNVDTNVTELRNVKSIGLDELSITINKTITSRKNEIPQAVKIIDKYLTEFEDWSSHQVFADLTKSFKQEMLVMKTAEIDFQKKKLNNANEEHLHAISDRIIQKITTRFITQLKSSKDEQERLAQINLIKEMFNL